MSAEGSAERISVSRETLRAELTELKIDIIDRITTALATKADHSVVGEHDKRITQLELNRAARAHLPDDILDLNKRVASLERFRYAWPSIGVLGVLVMLGTLAWYVFAGVK